MMMIRNESAEDLDSVPVPVQLLARCTIVVIITPYVFPAFFSDEVRSLLAS